MCHANFDLNKRILIQQPFLAVTLVFLHVISKHSFCLKATVPPYFHLNEYGDLSFISRINIEQYPLQKKKQSLEMCLTH